MTLNLSCGKCNAIRPFSGDPPACDICGWVYGAASKPAKAAVVKTKNDSSLSGFIGWIVFALIIWFILPASWTATFVYTTEYHLNNNQVHWNTKPTDCDFMHAPLGDKGCHYKKTVTAYNAAWNAVAGDDAPRYDKTTNGDHIVSYDDGKTWQLLDTPAPDPKVKSVEIGWVRLTD